MKFLVVWWYNYNKKYHMVLVIRFLDKVILKKAEFNLQMQQNSD